MHKHLTQECQPINVRYEPKTMYFPLLEALLQKNPELCKQYIHEFLRSEEDYSPLFKSMFTYAAQHSLSENSGLDAVVLSDCLVNVIRRNQKFLSADQEEVLFAHGIDYLCSISVDTIDTTALKPAHEEAKVVSIHDLEEAFEQDDLNLVVKSVRDILTLMDNKHYFMEIIHQIALYRSPTSIILASATSRAIEIMGWQNNFTPFLIYHVIGRLFHDKNRFEFSEKKSDVNNLFDSYLPRIHSVADLQFLSAAFYIHHDCKILADKIKAKIPMRLFDYFRLKESTNMFNPNEFSVLEGILCQSSMTDLQSLAGIALLQSKFSFAV